jgi:hypothetical protein
MISFKQEHRYMKSNNNEQVNHLRSFLVCKTKAINARNNYLLIRPPLFLIKIYFDQMDKLPMYFWSSFEEEGGMRHFSQL